MMKTPKKHLTLKRDLVKTLDVHGAGLRQIAGGLAKTAAEDGCASTTAGSAPPPGPSR